MKSYSIMIDAWAHILPPKYLEAFRKISPKGFYEGIPPMYDLEERFRVMDRFEGLVQVLTIDLALEDITSWRMRARSIAPLAM